MQNSPNKQRKLHERKYICVTYHHIMLWVFRTTLSTQSFFVPYSLNFSFIDYHWTSIMASSMTSGKLHGCFFFIFVLFKSSFEFISQTVLLLDNTSFVSSFILDPISDHKGVARGRCNLCVCVGYQETRGSNKCKKCLCPSSEHVSKF